MSRLTSEGGVVVVNARATLADESRAVQLSGYLFNTEHDFPLTRNMDDGTITVPLNALVVDCPAQLGCDPVLRGSRMYDRKRHTYSFTQNLRATIVFYLPFEELPESARNYITYRACRKLQDTEVGDSYLHKYTEQDEMIARTVFLNEQAEDEDLRVRSGKERIMRGI